MQTRDIEFLCFFTLSFFPYASIHHLFKISPFFLSFHLSFLIMSKADSLNGFIMLTSSFRILTNFWFYPTAREASKKVENGVKRKTNTYIILCKICVTLSLSLSLSLSLYLSLSLSPSVCLSICKSLWSKLSQDFQ